MSTGSGYDDQRGSERRRGLRWRFGRSLRRQAREVREQLGDNAHPGSNGHGRARALQRLSVSRHRLRRRRLAIALGVLLAVAGLGLVHRGCTVYFTSRARIEAAERIIRDEHQRRLEAGEFATEAEAQQWLEGALESLNRRYKVKG